MRYNEDTHLLVTNRDGLVRIWYQGRVIMTSEVVGDDLQITFEDGYDRDEARDIIIAALTNEVRHLRHVLEGA